MGTVNYIPNSIDPIVDGSIGIAKARSEWALGISFRILLPDGVEVLEDPMTELFSEFGNLCITLSNGKLLCAGETHLIRSQEEIPIGPDTILFGSINMLVKGNNFKYTDNFKEDLCSNDIENIILSYECPLNHQMNKLIFSLKEVAPNEDGPFVQMPTAKLLSEIFKKLGIQ